MRRHPSREHVEERGADRFGPGRAGSASSASERTSSTIGSGSAASPRPSARKPRSTAAIATLKGILSRNASSGTTRISVGERSLQPALGLTQRFPEMMELLAETEPEVVRQAEMLPRNE